CPIAHWRSARFKIRVYDANLYTDSNQMNVKTATAPLPILPIALILAAILVASIFLIFRMRARSSTKPPLRSVH
ncbi:hypothetical protein MUP00_11665, partial [Candidatus Bathyarchaeota archaeon]|nr:hypothetical protein [Candidatus Bathyarchaeota archaeon]